MIVKHALGVCFWLRSYKVLVLAQHNYKNHIAFQGFLSKDQISIFAIPPVAIFITRLKKQRSCLKDY